MITTAKKAPSFAVVSGGARHKYPDGASKIALSEFERSETRSNSGRSYQLLFSDIYCGRIFSFCYRDLLTIAVFTIINSRLIVVDCLANLGAFLALPGDSYNYSDYD